jgi:hypothetical protein
MALTIPTSHPRILLQDAGWLSRCASNYRTYGKPAPPSWDWWNSLFAATFGNSTQQAAGMQNLRGLLFSETSPYGYFVRFSGQGTPNTSSWVPVGNMASQLLPNSVSSDFYRVDGEPIPLILDWCFQQFTPQEVQKILFGWNTTINSTAVFCPGFGVVAAIMKGRSWGGLTMPMSNYFSGYFRNEVLYSLAAWTEDAQASSLLSWAIGPTSPNRWDTFCTYVSTGEGSQGFPVEGSEYGGYESKYKVIPVYALRLLGRDLTLETDYFDEACNYLLSSTSPIPVQGEAGASYYQTPPIGDLELAGGYPALSARNANDPDQALRWRDFMSAMASGLTDSQFNEYASFWMQQSSVLAVSPWAWLLYAPVAPQDYRGGVLDFYAQGCQHVLSRSSWRDDATLLHIQVGQPSPGPHSHLDMGNFQVNRNGFWLAKELSGYSVPYCGLNDTGTTPYTSALCHNTLAVNGIGPITPIAYRTAAPQITSYESAPTFLHVASDLTGVYRGNDPRGHPQYNCPNVNAVQRDWTFLRGLEVLVLKDWLSLLVAGIPSTALFHSPTRAVIDGPNTALVTVGNQCLRHVTLLPSSPSYHVTDTSNFVGNHQSDPAWYLQRLEVTDNSGAMVRTSVYVLQVRDQTALDIQTSCSSMPTDLEVFVGHPTRGSVLLVWLYPPVTLPFTLRYSMAQEVIIYGLAPSTSYSYRLDGGALQAATTSAQGTLDLQNLPAYQKLEIGQNLLPSINNDPDTVLAQALGFTVALVDTVIIAGRPWSSVAACMTAVGVYNAPKVQL